MRVTRTKLRDYHSEVVEALTSIGNPKFGKAVQQGFSFYTLPEDQVLAVWGALWRTSPIPDALFAALEYYAPVVRKRVGPNLWPVMRGWTDCVDKMTNCLDDSRYYVQMAVGWV